MVEDEAPGDIQKEIEKKEGEIEFNGRNGPDNHEDQGEEIAKQVVRIVLLENDLQEEKSEYQVPGYVKEAMVPFVKKE